MLWHDGGLPTALGHTRWYLLTSWTLRKPSAAPGLPCEALVSALGRPAPTFSAGLQQKAGLSRPLGPAAHRPCLPHSSLRQSELQGQIPGAALEIYPPAAFSLKMLRLIFSREFREKLLWFFVYRLLLWDLLDILQGFQACTLGKYLFLVIWSKGWKPHHTLCTASPTGLKVQEIFSAINRH